MIGVAVVAVMESTLIAMQAARLMVMPFFVAPDEDSLADLLPDCTSDDLRSIIRENETQRQSATA